MRTINLDDLLGYNRLVCDKSNQTSCVINKNNLLSALSVQYSYFDTDNLIASALFRSLIVAHGFQDGNKRTAVICLFDMNPPNIPDSDLEDLAIKIASGIITDVEEIAHILYE